MPPHTWIFNGEKVSDSTHKMYYRGQEIKEAWYRGEKIWENIRSRLVGIRVARLPNKLVYFPVETLDFTGARIEAIYKDDRIIDQTPKIIGIAIAKMPDKVLYRRGESMNYDGIIIYAVLSDGRKRDITTDCELTPVNGTMVPSGQTYPVVSIAAFPSKTVYRRGETLDYSGLAVRKKNQDGSEVDITGYCNFDPSSGKEV